MGHAMAAILQSVTEGQHARNRHAASSASNASVNSTRHPGALRNAAIHLGNRTISVGAALYQRTRVSATAASRQPPDVHRGTTVGKAGCATVKSPKIEWASDGGSCPPA